jgi:hypothetical protein
MHQLLADHEIAYTGEQLRSHWILDTFGQFGDAICAFLGPCDVATAHLVDLADVRQGAIIRARQMLHFVAEWFDADLERAILRQRLLVALAADLLRESCGEVDVRRRGDDLYVGERKLSVSIATASAVSTLVHFGVNVDPQGAPVNAVGLRELGVDPRAFARELMGRLVAELEGVREARVKVRGVP